MRFDRSGGDDRAARPRLQRLVFGGKRVFAHQGALGGMWSSTGAWMVFHLGTLCVLLVVGDSDEDGLAIRIVCWTWVAVVALGFFGGPLRRRFRLRRLERERARRSGKPLPT